MPRTKQPRGSVPVPFRLPREVRKNLTGKAQREAISFSELIRRALRCEINAARPANAGK
ncbi:MAG TPA: hypothetical protein VGW39_10160 [Chthoniobacterales bacterium]|nr:hypothetical protein [Chthoniobacterales bacterium]